MNSKVDFYFKKPNKWQKEIERLRLIVLDCGLSEELKWGCPCYTLQQSNIVLIHTFKDYSALLFFKGALLDEKYPTLVQQTKNVQAARQMRFTNLIDILEQESKIKSCIKDAIEIDKAGIKVDFKKTEAFETPVEFQLKLSSIPDLDAAFSALTPGRQRAYLLYFAAAKQAKTRENRIEKCLPQILSGKGLND